MKLMKFNIKHFVIFITIVIFSSCKKNTAHLVAIEGEEIKITDTITPIDSLEQFISPYRDHINKTLDEVIAYNPHSISKYDGKWNTAIGNLMADIVMEQSNPIYKKRTGKQIDAVLLNHGGIRSVISEGDITRRTAYEVMPFENRVVVLGIKGAKINEMVTYLIHSKKAHPVSGMEIILNADQTVNKVLIGGDKIDTSATYNIATSDYLASGGDNMTFFSEPVSKTDIDYLIRNELIDYFEKTDTIRTREDNRFTQL